MIQPGRREAAQVTLRAAHPADAPLLQRWRREASIKRYQPLAEVSLPQLRAELAGQRMDDLYRGRGERFQWIVVADDAPAGWITLVVTNWEHGLAELGYALTTAHQGRQTMRAALDQLLTDLFLNTALARIEARCAVGNVRSQKLLERLGFVREGRLREYFVLAGKRADNFLYALLRSDYGG